MIPCHNTDNNWEFSLALPSHFRHCTSCQTTEKVEVLQRVMTITETTIINVIPQLRMSHTWTTCVGSSIHFHKNNQCIITWGSEGGKDASWCCGMSLAELHKERQSGTGLVHGVKRLYVAHIWNEGWSIRSSGSVPARSWIWLHRTIRPDYQIIDQINFAVD